MDAHYVAKEGALVITITPNEMQKFVTTIQLLLEDEKLKTLVRIPVFAEDFFSNLLIQDKDVDIKFTAGHLEFGVALLEDISFQMAESGLDTSSVEDFLDQIEQFCAPSPTLN